MAGLKEKLLRELQGVAGVRRAVELVRIAIQQM